MAAYKGGSKDVESSYTRVDKYAEELRTKWKIEIVRDIPTLCKKVDAVLIESVDGRVHLEQAKAVIAAGKPMFIDKPLASTLEDAREIARLAKEAGVPWFSSSSLRYGEIGTTMKFPDASAVITWGPGPLEEHHKLDLSWYAIHPIEMLYALLGTGMRRGDPDLHARGRYRHRPLEERQDRHGAHRAAVRRIRRGRVSPQSGGRRAGPKRRPDISRCWWRS